jgi:hypothetical protein
MFDPCGDDVGVATPSRKEYSLECVIVCFAAAARENHFAWCAAEQSGNSGVSFSDELSSRLAGPVVA